MWPQVRGGRRGRATRRSQPQAAQEAASGAAEGQGGREGEDLPSPAGSVARRRLAGNSPAATGWGLKIPGYDTML